MNFHSDIGGGKDAQPPIRTIKRVSMQEQRVADRTRHQVGVADTQPTGRCSDHAQASPRRQTREPLRVRSTIRRCMRLIDHLLSTTDGPANQAVLDGKPADLACRNRWALELCPAEVMLPDAVDHHSRRQRIVRVSDAVC